MKYPPAGRGVLTTPPASGPVLGTALAPTAAAAGLPADSASSWPAAAGVAGPEEGLAAAAAAWRAAVDQAMVPGALEARPCSK